MITDPALCPTPQDHATHHYCPSCTFTSGTAPESDAARAERAEAELDRLRADLAAERQAALSPAESEAAA